MKKSKLNHFIMPVTAVLLLSSASVFTIANTDKSASKDSNEIMQSWQETKRDAKEYWGDFKQDAKQKWGSSKEAFRDGWIEGKLQSVLLMSEHIDVNNIDIDVTDYVATLSGTVDNQITRELAEELAKGVEGINEVDNKLEVKKESEKVATSKSKTVDETTSKSSVSRYISNSILTAELKLDLIKSESVPAMDIDITVSGDVVILEGEVESENVKTLAEKIVLNNSDVRDVVNRLNVPS